MPRWAKRPRPGVAVVGAVGDNPPRPAAGRAPVHARHANRLQRRFDERDFGRGGRGDMYSQRNTLAVDHHHPLRALAPLGCPDVGAPLFADANEPSRNVYSQCNRPRASRCPRNARHSCSHVSSACQARRRRQQVDPLGYPSGRSCHRAPVLRTSEYRRRRSDAGRADARQTASGASVGDAVRSRPIARRLTGRCAGACAPPVSVIHDS